MRFAEGQAERCCSNLISVLGQRGRGSAGPSSSRSSAWGARSEVSGHAGVATDLLNDACILVIVHEVYETRA